MNKKILIAIFSVLSASLPVMAGPGHNHGNEKASAGHLHANSGAHGAKAHKGGHSHSATGAHSHDRGHSHADDKKSAGPNGGRVIHSVDPHAEFFITEERKVQITFLDDEGKAIKPATQSVTVTTGSRANPLLLSFAEVDGVLLSDAALPEGTRFPIVLEIRTDATSQPVRERFTADLAQCPTCAYAEYACVCEHA